MRPVRGDWIGAHPIPALVACAEAVHAIKRPFSRPPEDPHVHRAEVKEVDRLVFELSLIRNYYEAGASSAEYLRNDYNLMNFGGTAHEESERT